MRKAGGSSIAEALGIRNDIVTKVRAEQSMSAIITRRSDGIPGKYFCIECGKEVPLLESFRAESDALTSCTLSTLFCGECAKKVQRLGVNVGPIELSSVDKLNIGISLGK